MSSKAKVLWISGTVAVGVVVVFLFLARQQGEEKSIQFGAVLPLTGDIAEYGRRCKDGMDLAVEEINAAGGVQGRKLTIIYEDSRGTPRDGVSALQKLIGVDRVKVVVGAVASSVTLAMEPIATKNRVILFSPASSSPKLTGISRYFFRDWPSDVFEATALAEFVRSELKLSSVAVLYVNNDYGLGLKNEFIRRFTELGGSVPVVDTYEQGASDFRTQLAKVKAANPDGAYLAGYHREMAAATKQIRELGIDTQVLGDGDYGVDELLEIAGNSAEGAVFSIPEYDPKTGPEAVKKFAAAFRERYGKEPTNFEANGYDAVKILCQALASVGADTDAVSDYIASLKHYQGASGDISFDEKREVVKPVSIKMVKDGKFVVHPKASRVER